MHFLDATRLALVKTWTFGAEQINFQDLFRNKLSCIYFVAISAIKHNVWLVADNSLQYAG